MFQHGTILQKLEYRGRALEGIAVNSWNSQPEKVVEAGLLAAFKECSGKHLKRKGIEAYRPSTGKWD